MKHYDKQSQKAHNLFILTEGLVIFLALFLAIVIYANWDAVKDEMNFAVKSQNQGEPTPPAVQVVDPTTTSIEEPAHIIINKIGVDTPILWDTPIESTLDALNHGVAHLKGTARLGQVGNVFITGHSSDYSWKKNPYAAVFSLVPKLIIGDIITIRENGKAYTYKVAQTKVVSPKQVEVTQQTPTPMLTLMTCYPVGTTRDRFIVHATLVSGPTDQASGTSPAPNQSLPEIKFR